MFGKIGATLSKWWRLRRGGVGWDESKPDKSPSRSICHILSSDTFSCENHTKNICFGVFIYIKNILI